MQGYSSTQNKDIEVFLQGIPLNSSILVAGSGDGKINHDISQLGYKPIGIDKDEEAIKSSQRWLLSYEFIRLDVSDLENRFEEKFKGIWLTNFFAKMDDGRQKQALEGIKQVLNGRLYIPFPNEKKEAITDLVTGAGFQVQSQGAGFLICSYLSK
jgi:SAM-dependent methyltransferase